MKERLKKVYYCNFCKKKLMTRNSMEVHERKCTMNPNRACGLCGRTEPLTDLVWRFGNAVRIVDGEPTLSQQVNITDIRQSAEYCPVCTLSILRQTKLTHFSIREDLNFDYKTELRDWWENVNSGANSYEP